MSKIFNFDLFNERYIHDFSESDNSNINMEYIQDILIDIEDDFPKIGTEVDYNEGIFIIYNLDFEYFHDKIDNLKFEVDKLVIKALKYYYEETGIEIKCYCMNNNYDRFFDNSLRYLYLQFTDYLIDLPGMHIFDFNINENYLNTDNQIGKIYTESDVYNYIYDIHRNKEDFSEGDLSDRIGQFNHYKIMEIPTSKINMDEWELDEDYMNDYIEKYKEIGSYPLIVLGDYEDRWGYTIIDGNHRANALRALGFKTIICFVGL